MENDVTGTEVQPGAAGVCALIVEDDTDIREIVQTTLELEGFTVATAANGAAALDYLRASAPPRVVLLDLMMPEMNGWQLREALLRDPALATIPVVVLTGGGDLEGGPQMAAVDDYVKKPIELDALVALLRRYCPC